MASFIGPRKLAPGPSVTVVAPNRMLSALTPRSLAPPLCCRSQESPALAAGTVPGAPGVVLPLFTPGPLLCGCAPGTELVTGPLPLPWFWVTPAPPELGPPATS